MQQIQAFIICFGVRHFSSITIAWSLSMVAGRKMKDNNPAIADLSDPNRPERLTEQFGEIYDNAWTDILDCLTENEKVKGEVAVKQIVDVLQAIYEQCKCQIEKRRQTIIKLIGKPEDTFEKQYTGGKDGHDPTVKIIKDLVQGSAGRIWEEAIQMAAATAEVALNVIANGPAVLEKLNSATAAIKSGLHNVKVSRSEADKLERELQGELFDKWDEKCEVMKATKIPAENIIKFLDHMNEAYEGINDNIRKKMEGVLFVNDTWEYKILEYKFNTGKDSGAKYGLIAFGKSPDQKYYDCMYVLYNMDFRVAKKTEFVEKKHRFLWGLFSWTTTDKEVSERKFGSKNTKAFQNFFRLKALQGFYKEGVIESINYVESLEDIPAE